MSLEQLDVLKVCEHQQMNQKGKGKSSDCCAMCKDKFILCKDHLQDQDHFFVWWKKISLDFKERKQDQSALLQTHNEFFAHVRGFMGTRTIATTDKAGFSRKLHRFDATALRRKCPIQRQRI